MNSTPRGWPRISSSLSYLDAPAAIDWLCRAFGFEVRLRIEGDPGVIIHSELTYGDGVVMIGSDQSVSKRDNREFYRSPKRLGGANTQSLFVYVDDLEAHCARAGGRRHHHPGDRAPRLRRGVLVRQELRVRRLRGPPLVVRPAHADTRMSARDLDRTFAALADPTRRGVIDLLRRSPRRAGELAEALSMSAPAMSRHLRVLRTTGLVEETALEDDARVRVYRLRHAPFSSLRRWLDQVEAFWAEELGAFAEHVERTRRRT